MKEPVVRPAGCGNNRSMTLLELPVLTHKAVTTATFSGRLPLHGQLGHGLEPT